MDHIKVCDKHPLRAAEATIEKLRKALIGLVGASGVDELKKMELMLRYLPVSDADKVATINAIRALIETMPETSQTSEPLNPEP